MLKPRRYDDMFYCCWILTKVAYQTNNFLVDVVNKIDPDYLQGLYAYADVNHCENPDKIADEIIEDNQIPNGNFVREGVPTWSIFSKVFYRLIRDLYDAKFYPGKSLVELIVIVMNHPIGKAIDDYGTCLYWQSPECIFQCYINNDLDIMDE